MSASRNFPAAFGAVMNSAQPLARASAVIASEPVAEFIDICDTALDLAFDDPRTADWMPGVDVEAPAAFLKAYLLFLVSEGLDPDAPAWQGAVGSFHERVTPGVWELLGFERAPARLTLELAFSLADEREHQAPELRALIMAVQFLAASELLRGLRS